jgi:hypothetical protein
MKDELQHYYWYGTLAREYGEAIKETLLRLFFSPIRGLHAAMKKRAPEIVFLYPLIRLYIMRGMLEGKESNKAYPLAHVSRQA